MVAVWGAAEALFTPALDALIPHLVHGDALSAANALLGVARSATSLHRRPGARRHPHRDHRRILRTRAGCRQLRGERPGTARAAQPRPAVRPHLLVPVGLREGWAEFSSRTWLWVTSAHVCLFNLFVWAPFLVLGPVVAQQRFDGAASWGLIMALYGAGAVAGGIVMLGRRPHRPLFVATAATLRWSLPSAALATSRSLPWICAAVLAAGIGSAVCGTLYATAT